MAKFYGIIGFSDSKETSKGVWEPDIYEQAYYGDIVKDYRSWEKGQKVNDDFSINNQFSIIADPYLLKNFRQMKYIVYMGVKWRISSIEIQETRLLISVGGEYNE